MQYDLLKVFRISTLIFNTDHEETYLIFLYARYHDSLRKCMSRTNGYFKGSSESIWICITDIDENYKKCIFFWVALILLNSILICCMVKQFIDGGVRQKEVKNTAFY